MSEDHGNPHHITVTIRTPAGNSHTFEVKPHDRVDKTVRTAVEYFVEHGQLAQGQYGLALVRDGQATEMVDSGRLEDYGIKAGDTLHLITKDPQVDG
ncbi:MAG: hypothetical protein IT305_02040 [Chloroflexi bacterium]|nr:hypothetical protein [Chloroflexota bacterium]